MSLAVIDSGALLELILKHGAAGVPRHAATADLVAPHLLDPEFLSSTRKLILRGSIPIERAERLIREFKRVTIRRFSHGPLLEKAWALRENITPYDAMYVALAQTLGVPLITADARLRRAAESYCAVTLLA
ncbi:type II toxin-antitoxin system VapC family toxin [Cryobacterium tepidiphilum]|uniref:PIN domain-containing protein n=1 Tax=Cryobacterium tepidiphilum TaxID=2486026 RepID=A0A3M8LPH6_9MICO|nr:type II toxin-antitoxin system VapC family toxin [Cryobacterium tepidiphilum]RNE67400.1 PIN domain-containing protein [Cryobacterium tepidiphilum]